MTEREAFEGVFPCSTGTVLNEYGHYESQVNQKDAIIQNISWVVWQAAKAQAIPDGYVLVPREPTEEMIQAGRDERRDLGTVASTYKAMIEAAQEPASD